MISLVKDFDTSAMSLEEARNTLYILNVIGSGNRHIVVRPEVKVNEGLNSLIFTSVRTGKDLMISKASPYYMYSAECLSGDEWNNIKTGHSTNSYC